MGELISGRFYPVYLRVGVSVTPESLQMKSCADNTDVCVYYNRFIVLKPNFNSVLLSRIFSAMHPPRPSTTSK